MVSGLQQTGTVWKYLWLQTVPLIPLLLFIDVSMKLNLIKVLRNAPDLISVHRVLLLGTASGFVDKLDNFFAEGTIVQWSPLFFLFVISISDHQMMDFKEKKSLQIGRADNNACVMCDSQKACYVTYYCFLDNRFINIFIW